MTTMKNIVNQVLMSILTTGIFTFSFASCSDELEKTGTNDHQPEDAQMALLEAYGLTFENFTSDDDVQILNADTTQISVSKAYADKLGIETFVGHPLSIWHKIEQLPYIRKATAEQLVGDRYILTVKRATIAEVIGKKKVNLMTDIYVNDNVDGADVTRADGSVLPAYAAKYIDENDVIHPAVIHLTDPYGYDNDYDMAGDQPTAPTRADGGYQYIKADELTPKKGLLSSARHKILSLHSQLNFDHRFECGPMEEDSINVKGIIPMDFELNYFITLDGGVNWNVVIPEPYVEKFEAGLDGKFAFKPEMYIAFSKKLQLPKEKQTLPLCKFKGYTFTFWVGMVPVAIQCDPSLFLKFKANVEGCVRTGFKYDYENEFRVGTSYSNGEWHDLNYFNEKKNDFTFVRPEANVHGDLGIGIFFGLDVKLYDVVGPSVCVGPNLNGSVDMTIAPFAEKEEDKFNLKAEVKLTVQANVGAKLEVLGYKLADWNTSLDLAGPWTLYKYPSDGSEHVPAAQKVSEQWMSYFEGLKDFSKLYSEFMDEIVPMIAEMNGTSEAYAQQLVLLNLINGNVNAPDKNANNYHFTMNVFREYRDSIIKRYKDYQYQKHAEAGDTEWIVAQNWKDICEQLKANNTFSSNYNVDEALAEIHQWFLNEFNREPSMALKDDVNWLLYNFNHYSNEKQKREPKWSDTFNAIKEANADCFEKDANIAKEAASKAYYYFKYTYNCEPTGTDPRIHELFRLNFEKLYKQEQQRQEEEAEEEAQKKAQEKKERDNADAMWAQVLAILKNKNGNDFQSRPRQALKAATSARETFVWRYKREPTTNTSDIKIVNNLFLDIMQSHR